MSKDPNLEDFPVWGFDGSSTNQARTQCSDCILKPVRFVKSFIDNSMKYIVLCEVFEEENKEHISNSRFYLRHVLENGGSIYEPWIGFEQEYIMIHNGTPLGWPHRGYPAPQGPYYCGVGSERAFGRKLASDHAHFCIKSGLKYYGMNAEVMPGQWEFQIGYRGSGDSDINALTLADDIWLARWILQRLGEDSGIRISFDNKPIKGDWNGSGMHVNFSTKEMRSASSGKNAIEKSIKYLREKHVEHILTYGEGLEKRLTGLHETSSIDKFSVGNSDRSCSIRIPKNVELNGYGYIEDRRPGANADPYIVAAQIISTICSIKMLPFQR